MGGALQLGEVEALGSAAEALHEAGAAAPALVELQDELLDVGAVVRGRVPPQADGGLGAADQLGRVGLVRLARLGQEGDRVAGSACKKKKK